MVDRRQTNRYAFSATAEVVEMASGAKLSTRAGDLSQSGCYLDTLNPFDVGTSVQVSIAWEGTELKCAAVVRVTVPRMGMGVEFTDLDGAQKGLIATWLEKLASPMPTVFSSRPSENAKPARLPDEKDDLAHRLIDLLRKKGLLTSNEVASLLRGREL